MANDFGIEFKREAVEHKDDFIEQLLQVMDPELGVDLANLGLIYAVDLDEEGNCVVTMTLTTMGCPLVDYLMGSVRDKVAELDIVKSLDVVLTFDPFWDIDRVSRFAKITLGLPL